MNRKNFITFLSWADFCLERIVELQEGGHAMWNARDFWNITLDESEGVSGRDVNDLVKVASVASRLEVIFSSM